LQKQLAKAEDERDAAVERFKQAEAAREDVDAAETTELPTALRDKARKCPFVSKNGIICPLIRR
jgi:hypothetical protein